MIFRNRRSRSNFGLRRRKKNYVPFIFFLVIVGFFFWAVFQLIVALFSNIRSETVSAELQILSGKIEFLLPDTEYWNLAFSEQKFLAGDRVKTGTNSRASFTILGGNTIFLDGNSELEFLELEKKSSGKKIVRLKLLKGQLWTKVSDDDFSSQKGSCFEVDTDRMGVSVKGTIFNMTSSNTQDSVRLIRGNVDVDIFDGENENQHVNMGVGQKLVASSETIRDMKNNLDVLEIIDSEFINSDWHLQNLEKFFPQEVAQIRRKIEISNPIINPKIDEIIEGDASMPSPQILFPENGTRIPASQDMAKIEGTAPIEAFQIEVNGYVLTRFNPGDKKWTYFGAKKFGTLREGENIYSVVAISREGKKSLPVEVKIFYEGVSGEERVQEATINLKTVNDFSAPVVIRPEIFVSGGSDIIFQTAASVVTIVGTVDPKTNSVKINGFKLKKFNPGDNEFSYIANATYGNMKEGENIYKILAFGPDGKTSETSIKIHYSPINIGD